MITFDRWQHILSVARKAKILALRLRPNDEKFAEDMFLLGVMHDLGYEFNQENASHALVGGEILKRNHYKYWQEVALHGDETVENMSDELFLLNSADMTTGPKGEDFSLEERLEEIAERFGKDSHAYQKCVTEVEKLKADKRFETIKKNCVYGRLEI